jgi:uncharacterized protein (DUF362 family)
MSALQPNAEKATALAAVSVAGSTPTMALNPPGHKVSRRALLAGGGLAAAGLIGFPLLKQMQREKTPVFIARNQRYDGPLAKTIRDGLLAVGLDSATLRGKRVLLKPNLVEPTKVAPHITTHPAVVLAAVEVFRAWGAEVKVGEAPGHVRDTEMALWNSGFREALDDADVEFADLNYEEVRFVKNVGQASDLPGIFFPKSICEADLVVSMPKMKTHHWAGYTASMKNLYGILPGIKYGWPKNVLHFAGIPETVFDINATVGKTIAIVDGITGMEGDGPIMGSPKHMGTLVIGGNVAAVDATVGRLMCIDPKQVEYLQLATDRVGPIAERHIEQRGEAWQPLATPFEILDAPHLQKFRQRQAELVS